MEEAAEVFSAEHHTTDQTTEEAAHMFNPEHHIFNPEHHIFNPEHHIFNPKHHIFNPEHHISDQKTEKAAELFSRLSLKALSAIGTLISSSTCSVQNTTPLIKDTEGRRGVQSRTPHQ